MSAVTDLSAQTTNHDAGIHFNIFKNVMIENKAYCTSLTHWGPNDAYMRQQTNHHWFW